MLFRTLASGALIGLSAVFVPRLPALTLTEALAQADARHPQIIAAEATARAQQAEARAEARWEAPELSLEAEDFGGSGDLRGTRGIETTLSVAQRLPLWQIEARRAVANTTSALATVEAEIARRTLAHRVTRAFFDAWEAREIARLAQEAVVRAKQAETFAQERTASGASAPAELLTARTERHLAETEALRTQTAIHVADAVLEGLLREPPSSPPELPAPLPDPLPDTVTLETRLATAPEARAREIGVQLAQAALRRAEADRLPEPTLSAGIRHRREDGETSFLMGISAPLPIYGAERDRAEAAKARLEQIRAEANAAERTQRVSLAAAIAQAQAALAEAKALRQEAIPTAEEACALAEATYRGGKAPLLPLLEAQRALSEVQRQATRATAEAFRTQADVRRLTD